MSIKTPAIAVAAAAVALALAGCSSSAPAASDTAAPEPDDKTTITIGFNPGPYLTMFQEGIQPILQEQGYEVETVDFTDGIVVNVAVSTGEIDANIMQHPVYLEFVNAQEGIDNAALVQIPTPPMSLWGGKQTSIDDVPDGATVSVPNAPSNLYRALLILQDVGWIEVDDLDDPNTATLQSVTSNPKNLNLVAIENAQQVPSLPDVDYGVIQGNFVIAAGWPLTDALTLEDQPVEFSNVVAIDAANLETPWAQALKAAYESPEFIEYIESDPQYDGYTLPSWF
jgi:D-methionine transport system substrate-binding protein